VGYVVLRVDLQAFGRKERKGFFLSVSASRMAAIAGGGRNHNNGQNANGDENLIFETSLGIEVILSFYHMGIRDDLLRGIYQYGFAKPSSIHQRAVMPIINDKDVLVQDQCGIGNNRKRILESRMEEMNGLMQS
jgi:hypothetical protein